MVFRRQRFAPLKKNKHEITWTNLEADFGTAKVTIPLIKGVESANANIASEVVIRSKVIGIYIEMQFSSALGAAASATVLHWSVTKEPFGTAISNPNLYYQADRRFILKRGMEMIPEANTSTVIKRIFFVKLPNKGTIGQDDEIVISMQASGTNVMNWCGIAIYKEIY